MKNFSEFCKDYLFEQLSEHEGRDVYACDMAFILCEYANCDGTMTYSRAEAIDYLREWWDDAAEYSEYEQMNFGERSNPFENPEVYMVRMVICGVGYLLSRCECVDEAWNEQVEITSELIEQIREQCPNEVEF